MTTFIRYLYLVILLGLIYPDNIYSQNTKKNQGTPLYMIKQISDKNTEHNVYSGFNRSDNEDEDLCHISNGNVITIQGIGSQVSPDLIIPYNNGGEYEITNSPSISIDPVLKNIIFTAATDEVQGVFGIDQEYSNNYGLPNSWSGGILPYTQSTEIPWFNPAVAFVKNGNARRLYTGCVILYSYPYYYNNIQNWWVTTGQGISYSGDYGSTWTNLMISQPLSLTIYGEPRYFLHRNHLAVDTNVGSTYYGSVYAAWTPSTNDWEDYSTYNVPELNRIAFKYSRNGTTWTSSDVPAKIISDSTNGSISNCGVNLQVGPNGEVYAVWAIYHYPESVTAGSPPYGPEYALGFTKSLNGGQTFSPVSIITDTIHGLNDNATFQAIHGYYAFSFPVMCVDHSPVHPGRIYVAWSNLEPRIAYKDYLPYNVNSAEIFVIHSDNSGQTWSTPVQANSLKSPDLSVEKFSVYPWITCDNETGTVCLVYYDDRISSWMIDPESPGYSKESSRFDTYVSLSNDGGNTWVETLSPSPLLDWEKGGINDVEFCTPQVLHYSDYNGIVSKDGLAYPAWTTNRALSTDEDNVNLSYTTTSPFYIWNCIPYYILNSSNSLQTAQVKKFECQQYISAYNMIIPNGAFGFFDAGDSITLHEGFHAQDGCFFHAYLDGCTPFTGNDQSYKYCSGSNSVFNPQKNNMYKKYLYDKLIKVYPNPTTGIFTVDLGELEGTASKFLLTNSLGETIIDLQPSSQQSIEINLTNYPKGLYFIKLFTGDKTYVNKVVHQ